jgi:tRNA threonylcarbamoyladenosine biosynthesis protein TsaB
VLDAHRQQLFAGAFERRDGGELSWLRPTQILGIEEWLGECDGSAWVTGPLLEKIVQRLGPTSRPVDPQFWHPTAAAVGRLALQQYGGGRRDDVYQLVPQYFRRSAAEEKLEAEKLEAEPAR